MKPVLSHALRTAWRDTLARGPDAVALIDASSGHAWTRQELHEQSQPLLSQWVPFAGQRVVFARANGLDWWRCFLTLLEVGATAVPLDPSEPAHRQTEVARALDAAAIWRPDGVERLETARRAPDAAALIKLTSGSTGAPRAIRFTAEQLLADGRNVSATMGIRPTDRNLAVIPFGHSYGLGNLVMPLLLHGTSILVPRAPLPRVLAEDVARWCPTVFPAVPALLGLLARADVAAADFASLRTVISAGSLLPPETAQGFHARFGQKVHGFYGSSETGGITYDTTGDATQHGRSVGTPLQGVTLTPTRGNRFTVASDAVYTLGNRYRDAAGRGVHRPADRAQFNAQGELVLLGRSGRLVKIAGRRLDLAEIERALREVIGVTDAFAQPHPRRADELAAAVQTRLGERELRALLAARLSPWKIPRRLVLLSEFPLTARGKPDAAALRRLLEAEPNDRSRESSSVAD